MNGTGLLSVQDVRKRIAGHLNETGAKELYRHLDLKVDKLINYSEFMAAALAQKLQKDEDLLKHAFKVFDTDSSGYITQEDLEVALEKLRVSNSEEETREIMEEVEFGRDGKISYRKFRSFIRSM